MTRSRTHHFNTESVRERVVIFTGNFGSGKTEVAVNYTRYLARHGEKLTIMDLDIVNPYFRCREARNLLEGEGIRMVSPEGGYAFADLPIVLPQIKGELKTGEGRLILDVGGDDMGARILSSLADAIPDDDACHLMVLNSSRPFMDTMEGCMRMIDDIERSSRLKVSGLVDNSHLIDETKPDVIYRGYRLAMKVSRKRSIPLKFITVEESILKRIDPDRIGCDILPIHRFLAPPWNQRRNELLGKDNFKL